MALFLKGQVGYVEDEDEVVDRKLDDFGIGVFLAGWSDALGIYWRDYTAAWHRIRPSGLGEMSLSGVLGRGPIGMVDPFVPAELRRFSMLVKVVLR